MIYLLLILDILINNYTNHTTYFFIIYLFNKSYKYYLLTGLILDLVIFDTFFINVLLLSIIYLFNKVFKDLNKYNLYNYLFVNIFNYLLYIILFNLFIFNNINNILLIVGSNLIINLIFYILSYRLYKN